MIIIAIVVCIVLLAVSKLALPFVLRRDVVTFAFELSGPGLIYPRTVMVCMICVSYFDIGGCLDGFFFKVFSLVFLCYVLSFHNTVPLVCLILTFPFNLLY